MAARGQGKPRPKAHGGKRPGAGRKPNEIRKLRKEFNEVAHGLIVDQLPTLIGNLVKLANGGYERVELEYTTDDLGIEVLSKRKVEVAEPDREANKYLIDRVLGRPRQAVEMSGPDSGAIPVSVEQLIGKVYGDDGGDPPEPDAG